MSSAHEGVVRESKLTDNLLAYSIHGGGVAHSGLSLDHNAKGANRSRSSTRTRYMYWLSLIQFAMLRLLIASLDHGVATTILKGSVAVGFAHCRLLD